MSADQAARLVDRAPEVTAEQMAGELVPPRQFAAASLENYRPDPDFPSQAAAVQTLRRFLTTAPRAGLFARRRPPVARPGVYLDGGFGVGKTHLLAALWHASPGRKYFGTFIEYTALIGALGYHRAAALLRGATLIAIDEFELDDPGDTMMMTRLLGELVASGSRIAATSNTPPKALGEGRFAAADFLREIHSLADRFDTVRIDGLDYRRRDARGHAVAVPEDRFDAAVAAHAGPALTVDDFGALLAHLATIHPSRYIRMIEGVRMVGLRDVYELSDQADALRLVAFIDRLYDAEVRVIATGVPLDHVFPEEMLAGGYRKKYLRAISRIVALTAGEPVSLDAEPPVADVTG